MKRTEAQASVLTVVILIVMVVFSIYAMSEYSIVIQLQQQEASTSTTLATSSSDIAVSSSSSMVRVASAITCGECSSPSVSKANSMVEPVVTISAQVTKTSSTSALVACPVAAQGNLVLTAYNSITGKPLAGLVVKASDEPASCGNLLMTIALPSSLTNSSGVDSLCCNVGDYKLSVEYGDSVYSAAANVSAGGLTCLSLFIPSGKVSIFYSATMRSLCVEGP